MNQLRISTGSTKSSPKSPDDNPKSEGATLNPLKTGRSPPSTKSSPGSNKTKTIAERLAQSTRGKINSPLRSPGSKSPPSPNTTSSMTDITKDSTDQYLKSDEAEKKVCNGSAETNVDHTQLCSEQNCIKQVNEISELKQEDISVESDITEIKNEMTKCDINNVVVVEGLDNSMKQLRIDDNVILEQTSKKDVRQKVWEFMEDNFLVVFPKPCFNRIPNFKGCNNASQLLEKLDEFKKAKTVQVTPDKAQETARFLTLLWGKRLLVPLLRLKEGLLQIVSVPFAEPSAKMLRSASTQKGLRKWGNKLITLDQNNEGHHIDMIILGSVAVDRNGHRIGIGNGFCDLEFVILCSMNMVTDKTVVVSIVHDAQVFDSLPTDIFKPYDVPVDIIITPTEIIRIKNRLERPKDVFWNYISKRRLLEMPPLQLLRTKQEKDSDFDCTLKDVDSEPEEIPPSPKTYKKSKGYRHKRLQSTRSEANDSVFKDTEVSKKPSTAISKTKNKRAKSISSQQQRSTSTSRPNDIHDKKERRFSKKLNKRRTKSESAKTVASPLTIPGSKNSNGVSTDSPSIDTPKNKRRSRQKPRQRMHSDDTDIQSIHQSNLKLEVNSKPNSRSNSRVTRRDYIDRQDLTREMSVGHKVHRDYIHSPKKYYSQSRPSYSQERPSHKRIMSTSRIRHDSNRSIVPQNCYSNIPIRPTRYFNGPMVRHNNFNGLTRQNGNRNIRYNSYSHDQLLRKNSYYDGTNSYRNSFSNGSAIRHDGGYTNSRVFRPPQYRNEMASQTDERNYVRESRPRINNNRPGYFNSNEKPTYSRSISSDEFVLKVGNIANNVRVRDLKAALMERGVKPMHITWRGPRGFAYLRYNNSVDVDKDTVIGSLQNVRIKPNGVETSQTQTLIVTECQFS